MVQVASKASAFASMTPGSTDKRMDVKRFQKLADGLNEYLTQLDAAIAGMRVVVPSNVSVWLELEA